VVFTGVCEKQEATFDKGRTHIYFLRWYGPGKRQRHFSPNGIHEKWYNSGENLAVMIEGIREE